MVVFVWHTLLLGSIGLDINDIANAVFGQEGGQLNGTMLCTRVQFSPCSS